MLYFERIENGSLDTIPLNHVEFELPVVEQAVDPFVDQLVALHAALNHHLMRGEKIRSNKEENRMRDQQNCVGVLTKSGAMHTKCVSAFEKESYLLIIVSHNLKHEPCLSLHFSLRLPLLSLPTSSAKPWSAVSATIQMGIHEWSTSNTNTCRGSMWHARLSTMSPT